jgi:sec-independent protein translocase protein TatA
MPNIGPLELAIVLLVVLLIFGPKRLPGLGRQLGSGMREFKDSITGKDKDEDEDEAEDRDAFGQRQSLAPTPPAIPAATVVPAPEVVTGEAREQDQPAPRAD